MDAFLKIVAKDLYNKVGNDLSRTVVVFPNKRAGLFFNEYLAHQSDKPIWSPAYISISELFQQLSPLRSGDNIGLICELYSVFRTEMQNDESLDDFYFWGELLLNDFDDIDKNLVDADKLFANLKDLKGIMDSFDFLDEEQEAAIQQFFQNFSIERRTVLKERFISLWDKLGSIYNDFRSNLLEQGIGYEGMIYRDAIARLNPSELPYEKYVFVGFNMLNKVEFQLLNTLKQANKAMFYWDYDVFYTQSLQRKHEAGIYMQKNLEHFPSSLEVDAFDNLRKPKQIQFIASPTENAQARYLPQWLKGIEYKQEKENAVVLCNESLLFPLLHSIPPSVENLNVTMGFPLSQTPTYTFVNALIELQTTGYNKETGRYTYNAVQAVLKHPYTRNLSILAEPLEHELTENNRFYPLPSELKRDELLEKLFTPTVSMISLCNYIADLLKEVTLLYRKEEEEGEENLFNQLYKESLFKSFTIVNRMTSLLESGKLNVKEETFKRLIHRLLTATNIPFHGEPAIGMQVMGVLETRNLDFKNLILMSFNEGMVPKSGGDSSFIPYTLRKAFGMKTVEHQDAIYAYYFYRLIQRAENITILYNTSADGLNRGEPSRYILQLLVEWEHPIKQEFLEAAQSPLTTTEISIEKNNEVLEKLHESYNTKRNNKGRFTPSALNCYLDCSLRFYFRYVARLKARKEINTEIDSSTFGSIFHLAVELIYKKLTEAGSLIRKEDLEQLLKDNRKIQDYVDAAFRKEFFHIAENEKPEYNGTQLINSKVIVTYVKQLLRNDMLYTPFNMVDMEKSVYENIDIETSKGNINVQIGGYIDRVDSKDNTLRIVDYKTGGSPKIPANIEQLFTPGENRPGYVFQTFLYAAIMSKQQPLKVAPSLLYIHRASSDEYSPVIEMGEPRKPKIPVTDFSLYEEEFRKYLCELLEEIFNPQVPFTQTEVKQNCEYCDYKSICNK
ncbi:PD-(D/E)XK nuclease family protein [Bacteroides sp. 214]|uniref:PD-(D/E)XK nuclease family protein n=1 Tax=Bacteroides sp. 214 TaxID=2302935 RepID=UPI0013D5399F|nr:PD-(D/E)XK nuclease family protein [Bacteroides sp. 214]NDW11596.1 PD-(D/E)XK nuclease family protein [Bacteroides sp. 214]